jgi:hypothetical protein
VWLFEEGPLSCATRSRVEPLGHAEVGRVTTASLHAPRRSANFLGCAVRAALAPRRPVRRDGVLS